MEVLDVKWKGASEVWCGDTVGVCDRCVDSAQAGWRLRRDRRMLAEV